MFPTHPLTLDFSHLSSERLLPKRKDSVFICSCESTRLTQVSLRLYEIKLVVAALARPLSKSILID